MGTREKRQYIEINYRWQKDGIARTEFFITYVEAVDLFMKGDRNDIFSMQNLRKKTLSERRMPEELQDSA